MTDPTEKHRAEARDLWADNDPEVIAQALADREAEIAEWLDRMWHEGKRVMSVGQLRMLDTMRQELLDGTWRTP